MQWVVENAQNLVVIGSAIGLAIVWLLRVAGKIQKERADELTRGIEDGKETMLHALKAANPKELIGQNGQVQLDRVANLCLRGMKGSIKQRMLKAGRAVAGAISDGAARVDPKTDEAHTPRPVLRRFGSLLHRAIPFAGG